MTRAASVTSELARTASHELRALAAVMRPDWDPDALAGAMTACHTAGWSWVRTFTEVTRMLTDDRAEPYQLRDATRQPVQPAGAQQPVDAETRWELLAPARAAVAAASLTWAERQRERDPGEAAGTVPGDDR